ncbi:YaeB-like protein [Gracilaria domingensis]|nr:YaeB-like protein [Gracilaria domingensis]
MQPPSPAAQRALAVVGADALPVKTRAQLKRELNDTLAPGEEGHFLNHVEAQLDRFHHQLADLSARRAAIMRHISVRERKLNDWKGKIPRTTHANEADAQREMQRAGRMPCICIARFRNQHEIVVESALCNALQGVEGFSKLWLLCMAPPDLRFRAMCSGRDIYLCLVHVRHCDVRAGLLTIDPIQYEGDSDKLNQVAVFDIKPYLSYCEAWTEKQPVMQHVLNDESVIKPPS